MILEHSIDKSTNAPIYRWTDSNDQPVTEWFTDFSLALSWIINYKRVCPDLSTDKI